MFAGTISVVITVLLAPGARLMIVRAPRSTSVSCSVSSLER